MKAYEAIVIGASAGCMDALSRILTPLPAYFPLPIFVVVHLPPDRESTIAALLQEKCAMNVCEADDKEPILPGTVYIAPPDYHMLFEYDRSISLSSEEEVLFSRPSIDVTFQSAADVYEKKLLGIVLTGGNNDGTAGLKSIIAAGGEGLVQDPKTAFASVMPESAAQACPEAGVLSLEEIQGFLLSLAGKA